MHPGDPDEGVSGEQLGEGLLVPQLVLVVELLGDPGLHLVDQRLRLERRVREGDQGVDPAQVREIGPDGLLDPRVLDLDHHVLSGAEAGPVDLADARGGEGLGVDLGEVVPDGPQVLLDHPAGEGEVHGRCARLELAQHVLELLGDVVAHEADHLTELHDRALHVAHRREHVLGAPEQALVEDRLGLLLVGEPGPGLRDRMSGPDLRGQGAQAGVPLDGRGRDPGTRAAALDHRGGVGSEEDGGEPEQGRHGTSKKMSTLNFEQAHKVAEPGLNVKSAGARAPRSLPVKAAPAAEPPTG